MPLQRPISQTSPNQVTAPSTLARAASGRLVLGGCDLVELARRYGTPLYLLDEATIRSACRAYRQALFEHYPPGGHILYASKAHCSKAVLALVHSEGLGLDAASAGELYTALQAGVPAHSIVMQGNNKPSAELEMALAHEVGRFNVDNLAELARLAELAERLDATPGVILRVAPGIEAHTHDFMRTGQEDSKFGLDPASGQVEAAMAFLKAHPRLRFLGLQAHIGSQIFDADAFEKSAVVMVAMLADIRARHGLLAAELDLGGGLGIAYTPSDDPPSIEATVAGLSRALLSACAQHDYPPPRLVLEPGRSIVGPAGVTLYSVGGRKSIKGLRTYVSVDGGMGDNPRPPLYGAAYTVTLANRDGGTPEVVTIAGRYCESGDVLAADVKLPTPESGDVLAVMATGAYNYSMASNYNRVGRPAVLLVSDGAADVIVERESLDDLTRLDRLPARLRRPHAP